MITPLGFYRYEGPNFYEKALFVKVDLATVLWWTHPLCPSRYASIRAL